jgi:hypothetical protein
MNYCLIQLCRWFIVTRQERRGLRPDFKFKKRKKQPLKIWRQNAECNEDVLCDSIYSI